MLEHHGGVGLFACVEAGGPGDCSLTQPSAVNSWHANPVAGGVIELEEGVGDRGQHNRSLRPIDQSLQCGLYVPAARFDEVTVKVIDEDDEGRTEEPGRLGSIQRACQLLENYAAGALGGATRRWWHWDENLGCLKCRLALERLYQAPGLPRFGWTTEHHHSLLPIRRAAVERRAKSVPQLAVAGAPYIGWSSPVGLVRCKPEIRRDFEFSDQRCGVVGLEPSPHLRFPPPADSVKAQPGIPRIDPVFRVQPVCCPAPSVVASLADRTEHVPGRLKAPAVFGAQNVVNEVEQLLRLAAVSRH